MLGSFVRKWNDSDSQSDWYICCFFLSSRCCVCVTLIAIIGITGFCCGQRIFTGKVLFSFFFSACLALTLVLSRPTNARRGEGVQERIFPKGHNDAVSSNTWKLCRIEIRAVETFENALNRPWLQVSNCLFYEFVHLTLAFCPTNFCSNKTKSTVTGWNVPTANRW